MIYKIQEDEPEVGCYFYVIKNGRIIYDSLQDSAKSCMGIEQEEFGISGSAWIEVFKMQESRFNNFSIDDYIYSFFWIIELTPNKKTAILHGGFLY